MRRFTGTFSVGVGALCATVAVGLLNQGHLLLAAVNAFCAAITWVNAAFLLGWRRP